MLAAMAQYVNPKNKRPRETFGGMAINPIANPVMQCPTKLMLSDSHG
jgi:hypothetical protein